MNKLLLLSTLLILSSSLHSAVVEATTTTNEEHQHRGLLRSVLPLTKEATGQQHHQHRKLAPPQCDDGTCRKKCSDCSSSDPECNPTHPQTCVASPPTPSPTLSPVTPSPTPLVSLLFISCVTKCETFSCMLNLLYYMNAP